MVNDDKRPDPTADVADVADQAGEAFLDWWEQRPPTIGGTPAFELSEAAFAAGAAWGANWMSGPDYNNPDSEAGALKAHSARVQANYRRKGAAQ